MIKIREIFTALAFVAVVVTIIVIIADTTEETPNVPDTLMYEAIGEVNGIQMYKIRTPNGRICFAYWSSLWCESE